MGINIPDNKNLMISLTYIFGIGKTTSEKIIKQANLDPFKKTGTITPQEFERIREIVEKNYKIEGDLRMLLSQNIKRLKEINSYRGQRHLKKLPVRGQRTKTNARTKRGKRVSVGSGRKLTGQKT